MWGDPDTAIGGNRDRFPSTQVSLIEAAGGEPVAMERVVALYWKPVYKFIRARFGKDNEAAKDLTQGFFASALEREFFQRFDPSKAGFRTYLRLAVERFAATQHEAESRQKRGGGVAFVELDDATASAESPEEIFFQEWRTFRTSRVRGTSWRTRSAAADWGWFTPPATHNWTVAWLLAA